MKTKSGGTPRRNPYLEVRLRTATSLELTAILYDVFLESLTSAADAAAAGRIEDRVRNMNRAASALAEMRCSLDLEQGGDIASSLDRLYAYAGGRLASVCIGKSCEEFWSLIGIFEPLRQAWHEAATLQGAESRPVMRTEATATTELVGVSA